MQIEELLHNTSVFGKNLTNLALVSFEIHFLHMRVMLRFLEGSTLQIPSLFHFNFANWRAFGSHKMFLGSISIEL